MKVAFFLICIFGLIAFLYKVIKSKKNSNKDIYPHF